LAGSLQPADPLAELVLQQVPVQAQGPEQVQVQALEQRAKRTD